MNLASSCGNGFLSSRIGSRPILWYVVKHYAHYGHKEFYIALGYKAK